MTKIITIDGPSGVGKGSVASALAQKLSFNILDSGALYRLVALDAIQKKINLENVAQLEKIALNLPVEFVYEQEQNKIYLSGIDVSQAIRGENIAANASKLAAITEIRTALLARQRAFAQGKGLVADGRDMGTVVFPNAHHKIFLTANSQERAKRRVNQLRQQGHSANISAILSDIKLRDERDCNRKNAPLKPATDAIIIDTSEFTLLEVIEKVFRIVNRPIANC